MTLREAWIDRMMVFVDHLNGNFVVRLGDAAGNNRVSGLTSGGVESYRIDSAGRGAFSELQGALDTGLAGRLVAPKAYGVLGAPIEDDDTSAAFGAALPVGSIVVLTNDGAREYVQTGSRGSSGGLPGHMHVPDANVEGVYTITRDLTGTGALAWRAGTMWYALGVEGDHWIELKNEYGNPRLDMFTLGASLCDLSNYFHVGGMNGLFGVSGVAHGAGIGDYSGGNYIRFTDVGGLEIKAGGVNLATAFLPLTGGTLTGALGIGDGYELPDGVLLGVDGNVEVTGDLTLSGEGKRITGDFDNVNRNNRVMFQTSTPNAASAVGVIPNGTSVNAGFTSYNNVDAENCQLLNVGVNGTVAYITSNKGGAPATYLPIQFNIGGSEVVLVEAAKATLTGDLVFSGNARRITGDFTTGTFNDRLALQTSTVNGNTSVAALPNGTSVNSNMRAYNASDPTNAGYAGFAVDNTVARLQSGKNGSGTQLPMAFMLTTTEAMRVETSGNLLIGTGTDGMTSDGSIAIAQDLAHRGTKVGFFNVTPATRPTAYTQTYSTASKTVPNPTAAALTDNSGGTATTTLEAIGTSFSQSQIRNNFADLAAMVNKNTADHVDLLKVVTQIIDDLQALGILQ